MEFLCFHIVVVEHLRQIRFILATVVILSLFSKCKKTISENYFNAVNIDSALMLADSLSKRDFNKYLKYNAKLLILAYRSKNVEAFDRLIVAFNLGSAKAGREGDIVITLSHLLEDIEEPNYTGRIFKSIADVYSNIDDSEASLYYDLKAMEAARSLVTLIELQKCKIT